MCVFAKSYIEAFLNPVSDYFIQCGLNGRAQHFDSGLCHGSVVDLTTYETNELVIW